MLTECQFTECQVVKIANNLKPLSKIQFFRNGEVVNMAEYATKARLDNADFNFMWLNCNSSDALLASLQKKSASIRNNMNTNLEDLFKTASKKHRNTNLIVILDGFLDKFVPVKTESSTNVTELPELDQKLKAATFFIDANSINGMHRTDHDLDVDRYEDGISQLRLNTSRTSRHGEESTEESINTSNCRNEEKKEMHSFVSNIHKQRVGGLQLRVTTCQ